jgi:hypothetical protein
LSEGPDARARKIALVADSRLASLLPELEERGYGVIQLPPQGLEPEPAAAWLEQVAEHVAEFSRHEYEIVIADDGSNEAALAEKLTELGVRLPPQYAIQPPSTSRLTPET